MGLILFYFGKKWTICKNFSLIIDVVFCIVEYQFIPSPIRAAVHSVSVVTIFYEFLKTANKSLLVVCRIYIMQNC